MSGQGHDPGGPPAVRDRRGPANQENLRGQLHLVLPPGQLNHYGNHSCDPNLWWADAYTLVARRPILAGEVVTSDYATSTGLANFAMACCCGSSLCRGVITGEDWRRSELQARYCDHWIPALLARIRRA